MRRCIYQEKAAHPINLTTIVHQSMKYDCQDLIRLFAECFADEYRTRLVGGAPEPIYLPTTDNDQQHQIVFTRDYYRSALHEVAHWCVAGAERRLLEDYGYWYAPDGRTSAQQAAFEQVEVKPQALEWLFCAAAGHPFRVSLDNLSGEATDDAPFKQRVVEQVHVYLKQGIPQRPNRFVNTLLAHYQPGHLLEPSHFQFDQL